MKYRQAVFIVVYAKIKDKIEYLILKRKLHWIGWEFPKGGIEKGESKEKAVKRELKEETGLIPLEIKDYKYFKKYKYRKLPDRPEYIGQTYSLFSGEVKKARIKLDPREHSNHKWVNFNKAMKLLTWTNQKRCLKKVNKFLENR